MCPSMLSDLMEADQDCLFSQDVVFSLELWCYGDVCPKIIF